jgi:hypothetical protein
VLTQIPAGGVPLTGRLARSRRGGAGGTAAAVIDLPSTTSTFAPHRRAHPHRRHEASDQPGQILLPLTADDECVENLP